MKTNLLFLLFTTASLLVNAQSWVQIGNDIDGEDEYDRSGFSISISSNGTVLAVGAYLNDGNGQDAGHVRVYENIAGVWTQIGNDIDGEDAVDKSGISVCLSEDGSILAIGAYLNDGNGQDAGHVRVYENMAGVWTQIGNDINGENAEDWFGFSVSLSANGSVLAIGARKGNGNDTGYVRIYENNLGTWTQIGDDIDGENAYDESGHAISLSADGHVVAIGAHFNYGNESNSGHVRVYGNNAGNWIQIGNDIDGKYSHDDFGSAVSLNDDGTVLAIGARYNDDYGNNCGQVQVYENIAENWTQIGNDINGEDYSDESGVSVSLSNDGSLLAIGARYNSDNGSGSGHVRVYKNLAGNWIRIGNDIDGEDAGDQSGISVCFSADGLVLAIGAYRNAGNGTEAGHVRVYNYSTGIEENLVEQCIIIYPNPATNTISVDLQPIGEARYSIFDTHGCEVLSHTYTDKTISVSSLPPGIYFLHIEDDGKIYKGEFIKE